MLAASIAWMLTALGVYAGAGALFAVPFVLFGAGRIDPAARAGSWGFRLIIVPGVILLWPLLARRWLRGNREPPVECNAHRRASQRFPVTAGEVL